MLGVGAHLQETNRRGGVGLSTWAVHRTDGTQRALLVNTSADAVSVNVDAARAAVARALALRGPGLGATSGVTLDGQTLGADGRWRGSSTATTVQPHAGDYRVTVPGDSALLAFIPSR